MEWVRQCAGTRGSIFRGYPRWRRAHKELGSSHLEPSHPAHRENLGRVEDCVLRTAAALPTLTVGYRPTTVQLRWLRSRVFGTPRACTHQPVAGTRAGTAQTHPYPAPATG